MAADQEEILADLLRSINPGDFILVKGSRGMEMERVAEGVRRHFAGVQSKGAVV
jgi:UDP-N-acetylmuramoyl-tripeptide--D-alanyl-D-alanine ligase